MYCLALPDKLQIYRYSQPISHITATAPTTVLALPGDNMLCYSTNSNLKVFSVKLGWDRLVVNTDYKITALSCFSGSNEVLVGDSSG